MSPRTKHQWQLGLSAAVAFGSIGSLLFDLSGEAQAVILLVFMAAIFFACGAAAWLDNNDLWGDE